MDSIGPDLFPRIEPYEQGMLDAPGGHRIYWEQSGNPNGVPVVFLHGGPGAGANPSHRRFFCPRHYRIIIFDQRGAGRSTPFATVEDNTTQALVQDMERLRQELGVDKWLVFGGSWGSTLALVYGITHPDRCLGFVLRGIFLGSGAEIDWFLHGMRQVFPEASRAFVDFLPEGERDEVLAAYHRRLMDPDPAIHRPAAESWSRYESSCSALMPVRPEGLGTGRGALSLARLEAHYFVNDVFLKRNFILDHLTPIAELPAIIVQGRYDMVCPLVTAETLHLAWPGSKFVVVPDAGHSAMEAGIRAELVRATEAFKMGAFNNA